MLGVEAVDLTPGSPLLEECFGPVALVAEYADRAQLDAVLAHLRAPWLPACSPAALTTPRCRPWSTP